MLNLSGNMLSTNFPQSCDICQPILLLMDVNAPKLLVVNIWPLAFRHHSIKPATVEHRPIRSRFRRDRGT